MARADCDSCGTSREEATMVDGVCARCRMDAWRGQTAIPSLDAVRDLALDRTRRMAESLKLNVMTLGTGKAYEYACKSAEFELYQRDSSPEAINYPFAQAEMDTQGIDLAEAMSQFDAGLTFSRNRIAILAAEEASRIRLIGQAVDAAAIDEILNTPWP